MPPSARPRRALLAAPALALALTTGCGGGELPLATTPSAAPPSGAGSPATGPGPSSASPRSTAVSYPTTMAGYAKEAVEAWRTDQESRLAQLTTSSALESFQKIEKNPRRVLAFTDCRGVMETGSTPRGAQECTFTSSVTGDVLEVVIDPARLGRQAGIFLVSGPR